MPLGTNIIFEPSKNQKSVTVTGLNPFPVQIAGGAASPFGEVISAPRTPIIELNSSYGTTALRDIEAVTNSATITSPGTGEILLSTGTTASSTAQLWSGERGRYIPGFAAQVGIGVRIPAAPTGNEVARWGLLDPADENGLYFGYDADGYFCAIKRAGIVTEFTRQADWNIDPADGTGDTGYVLQPEDGNIYQIDFTWYGYGQVLFGVLEVVGSFQRFVPLHQFRPTEATSLITPNLPIYVDADNGGDAADFDVYVGGRQYSIIGNYIPKFRFSGQERMGVSAADGVVEPLVSFRNKTGFEDRSLQIEEVKAIVQSNPVMLELYIAPTLTGASWVTPTNATASEVAVETDVSATSLTGGTLLWNELLPSGSGNNRVATTALQQFDIPENQIITLAARGIGGTATVDGFFRVREEW